MEVMLVRTRSGSAAPVLMVHAGTPLPPLGVGHLNSVSVQERVQNKPSSTPRADPERGSFSLHHPQRSGRQTLPRSRPRIGTARAAATHGSVDTREARRRDRARFPGVAQGEQASSRSRDT